MKKDYFVTQTRAVARFLQVHYVYTVPRISLECALHSLVDYTV
jgi:hypothetical protein